MIFMWSDMCKNLNNARKSGFKLLWPCMCHLKLDSRHLKPYQKRIVGAYHANILLCLLEIVVDKCFNSFKTTVKSRLRMEEEW